MIPITEVFTASANYENENRIIGGAGPSQRGYHTAILSDSRIFVFGGYNGSAAYEGTHFSQSFVPSF